MVLGSTKEIDINKLMTGDIILFAGQSLLGRLIGKFEESIYTHSGIIIWLYDELFLIEALDNGISLTKFQDYINSNEKMLVLRPFVKLKGSDFGKFMLPFVSKTPYDYFNLLVEQPISILSNGKINLFDKKTNKFICSSFIAFVYNHFYNNIFNDWYKIKPVDLFNSIWFKHLTIKSK